MKPDSLVPNDWTTEQAWQIAELLDALVTEIHRRYRVRFSLAHDIVERQLELALGESDDQDCQALPRLAPRPLPNLPPEVEDTLASF